MSASNLRVGRLKVISGKTWRECQVWVVPEDGGEAIFLPVTELAVRGHCNDFVYVSLRAMATEVDLLGDDNEEDIRIIGGSSKSGGRMKGGPDVLVTNIGTGEAVTAVAFVWAWVRGEALPRLYLRGRRNR